MIILQLKSAHRKSDFDSLGAIFKEIRQVRSYKIRGHEIQHLASITNNTSINERADLVIDFCAKNEIEYLTYHSPIFLNGEHIWEEKWKNKLTESIMQTVEEAEIVYSKAGLRDKVIVIVHLTNYAPITDLPISTEKRNKMFEDTAREFTNFYSEELSQRKNCQIAVENSLPVSHGRYSIVGPFHPLELARFEELGIGSAFDFAHYSIYSDYLKTGKEIYWGDTYSDAKRLDKTAPTWSEAIGILSKSLVQLHINDAKGSDSAGEGLSLGKGEIPLVEILETINSTIKRTIRGTIELRDGHLNDNRLQLEAADWLLTRLSTGVFE